MVHLGRLLNLLLCLVGPGLLALVGLTLALVPRAPLLVPEAHQFKSSPKFLFISWEDLSSLIIQQ